jgi:hypothetical protein
MQPSVTMETGKVYGVAECVRGTVRRLDQGGALRLGVVTRDFPYWGLAASSFRAQLSWVLSTKGLQGLPDTQVLFDRPVLWSSLMEGNWWARGRWLDECRGTTAVCFEDSVNPPGCRHPV